MNNKLDFFSAASGVSGSGAGVNFDGRPRSVVGLVFVEARAKFCGYGRYQQMSVEITEIRVAAAIPTQLGASKGQERSIPATLARIIRAAHQ